MESSNCHVIDNDIISVNFDGISLRSNSVNNTIAHNRLSKVKRRSIDLSSSSNNRIHDNDLSKNGDGISLYSSHNNTIYHNRLTDDSNCGISLTFSKNNIIRDNDISGSDKGIDLSSSDKNYVYHNNFIDNRIQAKDSRDTNRWDNGPIDGGNYWSVHVCTGNPSDGSQPYDISGRGATDKYPFMNRDGWLCTPPSPPTLADPGTNDTDGNYTVRWSSVSNATTYTLEEDTSSLFSSPTKIYSGSGTSKEITGRSEGTYYYRVKACNACGCSEWSNRVDINIDTIAPNVTISYPASRQTFWTNTIAVNGTASDNVGVSKVEVKVESESWQTALGTTSWNKSVTLAPGSNTIHARATDRSGNINQTSVTVICDITPPVIYHENIPSATEGESIPISATIIDDTKVASATLFYRNTTGEEAWITTPMDHIGDNYSATIPASNVTIAGVEYYIEAVDDASNTAFRPATAPTMPYQITVIITRDTIPPNVTITYPHNGQTFRTTTITVNGTASDNIKVSKVEVKVGSGDWQRATGTTSWSKPVTLETGLNTINASATDTSGNINQTSVMVFYNITPPVIYHEPITTATGGVSIPISAYITDDTNVTSATLFYRITGEEAWIPISMTHIDDNYSATIPASNVTTAGVEYYIEAVDDASNTAYSPATAPTMPYSITVSDRSIVTISVTPSTINPSESVTISGNIIPAHSDIVTLTFTAPNGSILENATISTINGAYHYVFTPKEVGTWCVNATWAEGVDHITSETASFTVIGEPLCYAVIIASRNNDQMQSCYDRTANNVYNKLLTCGFTHKRIFYLNPGMEQDVDVDDIPDVDRISSLTNVVYAINTWAQGNVSANDSLLIYMVGHCNNKSDTFIVNGANDNLTASDLNNYLNQLTNATGCDDITVVCEACNSGSFIYNLSRDGRIIVTSTGVNAGSFNHGEMGGGFSYYFFNNISDGKTIEEAFEKASNFFINQNFSDITPLLDDNGDKKGHTAPLPNEGDGLLAASKYIGVPPPIPGQKVVVKTTITILAVVADDSSIKDMYVNVIKPNFSISPTNDTRIEINLTTLRLEDLDGDGNYTASFTPTELGNYTLVLHATDDQGYMASSKQCIITAVSAPENAIFDTCEATNSGIFGKHNGIWNSTWKGVEAYFLGGRITSGEFTDANGHSYNNWIPAIRLEGCDCNG